VHGIEECVKEAQKGGAGLIVYNRKEGRALGRGHEILVYNARKRQEGGDQASTYFERTECVAGVRTRASSSSCPTSCTGSASAASTG
jgi:hypothetical protein